MAENGDDVITSWRDRVGSLRKRGRTSAAALTVVPGGAIDVRIGRPPAPERLTADERELWEKLTFSRRPGWFAGAETLLESYVTTSLQVRALEAALRKKKPDGGASYGRLARMHRHSVALAANLAVRLRLTPSTKLDKRTPTDGDLPVA